MASSKLGRYIEQSDVRNVSGTLTEDAVVGLATQKEIIKTKADLSGVNLNSYKVFPPMSFAYVPDTSRRGEKIALAFNNTTDTYLVSSIYIIFFIKDIKKLDPWYLFMYLNRPEFDRYSRFNSWGSARETFDWEDMCDISINLPPLPIQQKYANIYKAMVANQQSYERGLEDLKLVCDGYIEDLRRKMPCEKIGKYLAQKNLRNTDKSNKYVVGLSTKKEFREAQSRVNRNELGNYKIVEQNEFAFVPTTDTWKVLAFALNKFDRTVVVSPIYEVFSVDKSKIAPEYLSMWLSRKEFDRYARFHSWGSARENFSFDDMANIQIPIPDINVQKAIAEIYSVYVMRKKINEQLKVQIKNICPILIKGSLEEGRQMPGLLYPAYQKFYSALCSLDRFDKETNFFDNISCIDNFFSEYRNITFVIHSQLKHTKYNSVYEENKIKYLDHWFVNKRNETTKQQPFQLIKKIVLTVYSPYQSVPVLEKEFSVENDMPLESLFSPLKNVFASINNHEIFFSASFSFHEVNNNIDLFDKLISGISTMQQFMDAMEMEIREECPLCSQLKEKIKKITHSYVSRDFLLVNDYVYYPDQDIFEREERFSMRILVDGKKETDRWPLNIITQSECYNYDGTPFGNFTLMHAILRCIQPGFEIIPVIMVVYDDETYTMDVFHSSIKTTFYRKINEVAKLIETQNIKEVCYISLYTVLNVNRDNKNIPSTSKEREKLSDSDILICASIDYQLNEKEYVFDGKLMECTKYVFYTMKNGLKNSLSLSRRNMYPIWQAFKNKSNNSSNK